MGLGFGLVWLHVIMHNL